MNMWYFISAVMLLLQYKLTVMIKFLSLATIFLLLAAGSYAVGGNTTTPLPNTAKPKAKVTTGPTKVILKDGFKARYWIVASLFRL